MHPLWRILLYLLAVLGSGFMGVLAVTLVYILAKAALSGRPPETSAAKAPADLALIAMLGGYVAITLLTFAFARWIDGRSPRSLGFRKERWQSDLLQGALLGLGFIAIMSLVYLALGWVRMVPQKADWGLWIAATLLLYPLVGVTEELVFRGYLLTNLEEWKDRTTALMVTSILFWLVHLGSGNVHTPVGALSMLSMGATFALFRYGTGSLWFPIGLHAAFDWAALTFCGSGPGAQFPSLYRMLPNVPAWLVGPPGQAGIADLCASFLLLGGAYYAYVRSQSRPVDGAT